MGSASILSNYPANFSNGNPIMYVNSPGTGMMTLGVPPTIRGISSLLTYRTLREKGADVMGYMEKWVTKSQNMVLRVYRWAENWCYGAQHTTDIELWPATEFTIRSIWLQIRSIDGRLVYEHKDKLQDLFKSDSDRRLLRDVISSQLPQVSRQTWLPSIQALAPTGLETGTTNEDEICGLCFLRHAWPSGWLGHVTTDH